MKRLIINLATNFLRDLALELFFRAYDWIQSLPLEILLPMALQ